MEQSELFRIASWCCYGAGGLLLVLALVFFFAFNIPVVLRELRGKPVKVSTKDTEKNAATGQKKKTKVKTTAALERESMPMPDTDASYGYESAETMPLQEQAVSPPFPERMEETVPLCENRMEPMPFASAQSIQETVLLNRNEQQQQLIDKDTFVILSDITFLHTQEHIE